MADEWLRLEGKEEEVLILSLGTLLFNIASTTNFKRLRIIIGVFEREAKNVYTDVSRETIIIVAVVEAC